MTNTPTTNTPQQQPTRPVHLAAHFPGVNNATVWSDPQSGSNIDFASFKHMAATAERGLFDFFFLAEGLRLREHKGKVFDLDTMGRPETISVLAALAQTTTRLGLAGTLSATFNEPYDLARRLGTLDLVSAGRAAWNVVTSNDAFTGENFRRGGYLDYADRYRRAEDFIAATRELWESRRPDSAGAGDGGFAHRSDFFDIAGTFPLPPLPQGHPVVFQAGDSPSGRDFAAGSADVIFTRHTGIADGAEFVADVKSRAAGYGRDPESLKVYPGVSFVIGDTQTEAQERSRHIGYQQVSPAGAIAFLERTWDRDLSGYDPDGPLPDVDPGSEDAGVSRGRVKHIKDAHATVAQWRELAAAENLSIRDLVVRVSSRHSFVGTPASIAQQMSDYVQARAADGFILVPHLTPGGLDEFVDKVVPELQELGVYRDNYPGTTLRQNLDLPDFRPAADWEAARLAARATEGKESAIA